MDDRGDRLRWYNHGLQMNGRSRAWDVEEALSLLYQHPK